jgi:hypothetical protein
VQAEAGYVVALFQRLDNRLDAIEIALIDRSAQKVVAPNLAIRGEIEA